jgi:hypothetical protein
MFVYISVGSSSVHISLSFANISSSFIDGFLEARRLVLDALLMVSTIVDELGLLTMEVSSFSLGKDSFVTVGGGGDLGIGLGAASFDLDLVTAGGLCDSTEISLLLVEDDGEDEAGTFTSRFPVSSRDSNRKVRALLLMENDKPPFVIGTVGKIVRKLTRFTRCWR